MSLYGDKNVSGESSLIVFRGRSQRFIMTGGRPKIGYNFLSTMPRERLKPLGIKMNEWINRKHIMQIRPYACLWYPSRFLRWSEKKDNFWI